MLKGMLSLILGLFALREAAGADSPTPMTHVAKAVYCKHYTGKELTWGSSSRSNVVIGQDRHVTTNLTHGAHVGLSLPAHLVGRQIVFTAEFEVVKGHAYIGLDKFGSHLTTVSPVTAKAGQKVKLTIIGRVPPNAKAVVALWRDSEIILKSIVVTSPPID